MQLLCSKAVAELRFCSYILLVPGPAYSQASLNLILPRSSVATHALCPARSPRLVRVPIHAYRYVRVHRHNLALIPVRALGHYLILEPSLAVAPVLMLVLCLILSQGRLGSRQRLFISYASHFKLSGLQPFPASPSQLSQLLGLPPDLVAANIEPSKNLSEGRLQDMISKMIRPEYGREWTNVLVQESS